MCGVTGGLSEQINNLEWKRGMYKADGFKIYYSRKTPWKSLSICHVLGTQQFLHELYSLESGLSRHQCRNFKPTASRNCAICLTVLQFDGLAKALSRWLIYANPQFLAEKRSCK